MVVDVIDADAAAGVADGESGRAGFGDGTGVESFSLRLLGHNRPSAVIEVQSGMTLGELVRREGLPGSGDVSAINAAGARLRAGDVLQPGDDPVTITGRLNGAAA